MKKVFFFAAIAAMFCSCASTSNWTARTARTAEFNASVVSPALAADLRVDETKVSGNTDGDRFTAGEVSQKVLEDNAVAVALAKVGADVLIQPIFTYTYMNSKLTSVAVTGYPGFYTNFRKAECKPACEKKECGEKKCDKKCCCDKERCAQVVVYGAEVNNAPAIAAPAPAAAPAAAPKAVPAKKK